MPSRPPSPAGSTPETLPSSVFLPVFASTFVIVPSSREATSRALSSGSGATPHGVFRPVATVRSTLTEPLAGAACSPDCPEGEEFAVALGGFLSPPLVDVPPPPPEEHPAVSRSAVAANMAGTARRSTILVPSGGGPAAGSTCLTPLGPRRFPINRTRIPDPPCRVRRCVSRPRFPLPASPHP